MLHDFLRRSRACRFSPCKIRRSDALRAYRKRYFALFCRARSAFVSSPLWPSFAFDADVTTDNDVSPAFMNDKKINEHLHEE
jgi:hypothetical protein